jgi:membrane-associated phospholipid phosphatase
MKLTETSAQAALAHFGPLYAEEVTERGYRVAQFISVVALPPLLAIATIVAMASHAIADPVEAARVALVSSFFIAIAPVLYIAFLLRTNRVAGGVDLALKEERWRPYLVGIGSCILGFLVLMRLSAPHSILLLTMCYAVNTAVMALITQRWKISAHAAGAALPATALVAVFGAAALAFAVIVPVVCWARVRVHMHTVAQVSAGAVIGSLLTWLQLTLLAPYL